MYFTLSLVFPIVVEVSMAMAIYSFDEAAATIQVCAELTDAPVAGLECSIVATLCPIDGPKAGNI